VKVLIGLPSYNGWLRAELAVFLATEATGTLWPVLHEPTDVARNKLVRHAQTIKADVLFMFDADAAPTQGTFKALLDKAIEEPCVVAAPYLSGSGHLCVEGVPLAEAVKLEGLHRVGNVGTHVVAYSTSVFEKVSPPYFSYGYNAMHTALTDSEDCVAHRKLAEAGVPIWCAFDHWAGHVITKKHDKPRVVTSDELAEVLKLLA